MMAFTHIKSWPHFPQLMHILVTGCVKSMVNEEASIQERPHGKNEEPGHDILQNLRLVQVKGIHGAAFCRLSDKIFSQFHRGENSLLCNGVKAPENKFQEIQAQGPAKQKQSLSART